MRLIDAIDLEKRIDVAIGLGYADLEAIKKYIERVPAFDIVQCKDCKWWNKFPSDSAFPDYRRCNAHALARMSTRAKDFCSRAERRC